MSPAAPPPAQRPAVSLRRYLLLGILIPIGLFVVVDSFSLYRQTRDAVNTAYDRSLLASAKSISEALDVEGEGASARLSSRVPYAALEAFEADNRSRMAYRVSSTAGELVDGFEDLAVWRGTIPARGPYAALVDFYDGEFRGDPVRVAVLLQPVASERGRTMAVIQVAETLELRQTLTHDILIDTLWRQAVLVAVIVAVVVFVVHRATLPVRRLSEELSARPENDLRPLEAPDAARELHPLVEATNALMARLQHLLEHRKRFVRDASHQLRTPLAVLKVQVQSALRGDIDPRQALEEINGTVERATALANQMLALAKVEQLRHQPESGVIDWSEVVRAIALDTSPLVAERDLDFAIEMAAAPVKVHEWMLRELTRNLLHNAIKHSPTGAPLAVRVDVDDRYAALTISDHGPGIPAEVGRRLFQPFSAGGERAGAGLGLAICREIVQALGGSLQLDNRESAGRVTGLDAIVRLPLAPAGARP